MIRKPTVQNFHLPLLATRVIRHIGDMIMTPQDQTHFAAAACCPQSVLENVPASLLKGEMPVHSIRIWNSNICPLKPSRTHPDNYLHFGWPKCELITSMWKLSAPSLGQLKVITVISIPLIGLFFLSAPLDLSRKKGKKAPSDFLSLEEQLL